MSIIYILKEVKSKHSTSSSYSILFFRTGGFPPGPSPNCSTAYGHNSNSNHWRTGDHVQTGLHVWNSHGSRDHSHNLSNVEHENMCKPPLEVNQSPQRFLPYDLHTDCVDLGTLRDSSPRAVHGDLLCALPRTLQCPLPLES